MPKVRSSGSKSATVTVTVNGKRWQLVSSLADAGPHDHVFSITTTADGKTIVQFGDGVYGARPPASGKITVTYRSGGGASGNVDVTLTRAASDPTLDQALWVAIRNRARGLSFEFNSRRRPAQ